MDKQYLTVDALTKYLKHKFDHDDNLKHVYLKGEISNFKAHSSGHFYFSIKDEKSKINAIMFSQYNRQLGFEPTEGMSVLVIGRVTIYEQVGTYQIYFEEMIEEGVGSLFVQFEKLKEKLALEGLFDDKHKSKIPEFPEKVGVVTALTGAAVRDIISTLKRRFPITNIFLFPCLVQGTQAHLDIIKKIKQADQYGLDVIIVGRGGGSIEDLWPFNEEELARTIFACKTPIISAVGHEIDFTISDFVADLRAPTPTAAAELAVPSTIALIKQINRLKLNANEAINQKINMQRLVLDSVKNSFVIKNPLMMYQSKKQYLDSLTEKTKNHIKIKLNQEKKHLNYLQNLHILKNPLNLYKNAEKSLLVLLDKLEILNPLSVLKRGFSVTYLNDAVINNISLIKKDDIIITRLFSGNIKSKIIELEEKNGKKQI